MPLKAIQCHKMNDKTKITMDLGKLNSYRKELSEGWFAKVGIFGDTAVGDHEGVSNVQLGILHEFGGTINHPGGTPYIIDDNGQAKFIPERSATPSTKRTKPHKINIPPRSWLRMPLETKKNQIMALMGKNNIRALFEQGHIYEIMQQVGREALEIIDKAFETRGFGRWAANKASTIRRKGSDMPLMDTGELKKSVQSDVIQKQI